MDGGLFRELFKRLDIVGAKLDTLIAQVDPIKAAWWDGFRTGLLIAVAIGVGIVLYRGFRK